MKKNIKILILLSIVISIVCLICLCLRFLTTTSKKLAPMNIDYSDIENMNIGAEMPTLIYGDKGTIVFQGTCGIIVYDYYSEMITDRISYEELIDWGLNYPIACVSIDGSTIYFAEAGENYAYGYTIQERKLIKGVYTDIVPFPTKNVMLGYDEEYGKYIDNHFLNGETIIENQSEIFYLRANTDWSMNSLQLVICEKSSSTTRTQSIFKER